MRLSEIEAPHSPFTDMPSSAGVRWVQPSLIAVIDYREFNGRFRHPAFKGIVKLLTWCGAAGLVGGGWGDVQGLPVSDRGHRARGVAVSPFRAESARRRGADAGPRRGGHLRDDPVLVCEVRAGLRCPVTSAATPPRRQMAPR